MLRALTLQQPWAYAIMRLGKPVENRTWKPPKVIIGKRIAIHAGKTLDSPGDNKLRMWLRAWGEYELLEKFQRDKLVRGAIVGTVVVTGYARSIPSPIDDSRRAFEYKTTLPLKSYASDLVFSRWAAVGSYQWGLSHPIALDTPIPCRGAQGVWSVPPDLENLIIPAKV